MAARQALPTQSRGYPQQLHQYASRIVLEEQHIMIFRELQRANIAHIQNELGQFKSLIRSGLATEQDLLDTRLVLREYATAIRDYDYLQSMPEMPWAEAEQRRRDLEKAFPEIAHLNQNPYDTLYSSIERRGLIAQNPLRIFLSTKLPRAITWTKDEKKRRFDDYCKNLAPEDISPLVDKLTRFLLAFSAGAAIMVPVVLMAINPSQIKGVIITTVAVSIFAAVLSLGIRVSDDNTLVATATYAAVLVVFVGTNGSG